MSDPKVDYPDHIYGLRSELVSAQSALNMPPDPIPGSYSATAYLSDRDRTAEHAYRHVCAALRIVEKLEIEQRARHAVPPEHQVDPHLISVRVELKKGERNHVDPNGGEHLLGYYDLPAVPAVGEMFAVDGQPYRVVERHWECNKNYVRMHAVVFVR